jgi:hypothetical protein
MLAERSKNTQPWPAGDALEGPDAETDNCCPFLTRDNHDLFYATKIVVKVPAGQAAPAANFDLVTSIKLTDGKQVTSPTPLLALCTAADEMHPWLTADSRTIYFSRKTEEGWRVFTATRKTAKEPFGEPRIVEELPAGLHHATLNSTGLVMYLQGPLQNNRWGLFRATRTNLKQPWGKPKALDNLNSPEAPTGDMSPCLNRDGSRLYFSSDRPGGKGGKDLWVIDTLWF